MIRILLAFASVLLFGACSTTSVPLTYAPGADAPKAAAAGARVAAVTFTDHRDEPPTYLGAIRGGFGNPLKTLESDRPVADVVQAAFVDGLKARGVATGGASVAGGFRLTGRVLQLDANQVARRLATAEVELSVVETPGNAVRLTRRYSASRQDGELISMDTGVFASVEDLRVVMEQTLRELVDKALDDPELRAAMAL